MEKVKLPREIANAIDHFKSNAPKEWWEQSILKVALDEERWIGAPETCQIIKDYVNVMDNLRLFIKAIANGYEVEETPEDKVREYYKVNANRDTVDTYSTAHKLGTRDGILATLDLLNIKIEGIN